MRSSHHITSFGECVSVYAILSASFFCVFHYLILFFFLFQSLESFIYNIFIGHCNCSHLSTLMKSFDIFSLSFFYRIKDHIRKLYEVGKLGDATWSFAHKRNDVILCDCDAFTMQLIELQFFFGIFRFYEWILVFIKLGNHLMYVQYTLSRCIFILKNLIKLRFLYHFFDKFVECCWEIKILINWRSLHLS